MLGLLATSRALAADCFPSCRAGYLCAPDGRCVSECNPPCEGGTTCRARQCVATSSTPTASSSSVSAASRDEDRLAPKAESSDHRFSALAGPTMFVAKETVPGVAMAFRYKTPGDHAFVVGPRLMMGMPEGSDFGVVGVDAGYRGNFAKGDLQAGIVVLSVPQIWIGGSHAMLHVGGAVGPFVHFHRFELQLPIGAGFATLLEEPFGGRSRDLGAVVTANLLGGVTF